MNQSDISHLMLELCRAVLLGNTPEGLPTLTEPQRSALFALADQHDIAHLVSRALYIAGQLDSASESGAKLHKAQLLSVFRCEHQRTELQRTRQALEQAGIVFIVLKGGVLRDLYPEPWMRTSTDLDLLVHRDDLDRAARALADALDYQIGRDSSHDLTLYSPSGVHIELHFDLIEDGRLDNSVDRLLNDVWSYARPAPGKQWEHVLSDDMFYFYHIAHMVKHFAEGGCGVRTYIDQWLLLHRVDYDAQARQTLLDRSGLATFERVARHLCEVWMAGEAPTDLAADMAAFVLRGGAFGAAENYVTIRHSQGKSKLRYTWERIFMPYEELCTYYTRLNGRRYLTFYYQICRICRLLGQGRMRSGVQELRVNRNMSEDKVQATADLFKQLNI